MLEHPALLLMCCSVAVKVDVSSLHDRIDSDAFNCARRHLQHSPASLTDDKVHDPFLVRVSCAKTRARLQFALVNPLMQHWIELD